MRMAAVTGGSGTVGSATVRELLEHGWRVRALARSEASAVSFPSDVEIVRGDVENLADLEGLVDGADTVFHIAGVNSLCVKDRTSMWATNVEAPVAVYEAATRAGARRMVHISSAAAVGHRTSFYAETKWAADERLQAAAAGRSTGLVLVAPSSVQGPGRVTGTGKLILDLIDGKLNLMIDTAISIIDIADCAMAIRLAADADVGDDRLILSGFTMTTRDALGLLARDTDRRFDVRFVPSGIVRALALLGPLLLPIGRKLGVELCAEMIRTMSVDHIHDGSDAARQLGMTYRSASETFRRLIEWAETNPSA